MRIHHLNCCTFCPLGGHLMDRITDGLGEARLVCHCLLIEASDGLILVDTGLGTKDISRPRERTSTFFRNILRPKLAYEETAIMQIKRLGFKASDVKHIILTHLDFDHAGGIDDFPMAQVHLMQAEVNAATNRNSFIAKRRYQPRQFSSIKSWNTYSSNGERWFGFESVRELVGIPPEILLIPLCGHTEGHAGVAVSTDQGWILHAGDAYFFRGEMNPDYSCPSGLRTYQAMMEVNRKMRLFNQQRLRELSRNHHEIRIFSAHDAIEYDDLRAEELKILSSAQMEPYQNVLWMRKGLQQDRPANK
jgi:glyoxylase-like metal-dependent hydrolase (beta-lactamase superfamily II)